MTNPLERNLRQPILDLVQRDVSLKARSLEKIKSLPHLRRVTTLVFFLLEAKSRFWEQSDMKLQENAQSELEGLKRQGITPKTKDSEGTSGLWPFELLVNSGWRDLYLSLDKHGREDLPRIIAEKIEEYGDLFGFGQQVTRSILEMANGAFEDQIFNDSIKTGTHDPKWNPNPTDYLQIVMVDMFVHDA